MTGDVCDCGICAIDVCDVCGGLVAFLDDDGEAWCRSCFSQHEQNLAEQWEEMERRLWHGGDDWLGGEAYRRQMREAGR